MSLTWILILVSFGASFLVRQWLNSTYRKWSTIPNAHGVTGAETAAAILRMHKVTDVKIESVRGRLTDHFDPVKDVLRLSASNYEGRSVAAMAVAAHEAGHALQDAQGDSRLKVRKSLVPLAAIGSRFSPWLIGGGFLLSAPDLTRWGMWLMVGTLLFQIVTLPVEFNASRRALDDLEALGLTEIDGAGEQAKGAKRVLTAAAFTYVAAAATSLAYIATLFIALRGRNA